MSGGRVEGAPRLIEWTGERCVPWIDDPPVIYEHFHRYLFAARLVDGQRVLDLASGEGFGAALLAEHARSVLGLDLDEPSVAHATANYSAPGLEFQVGDALRLGELPAGAFDAVVAFEMLEHISDQERILAGIRHVLASDGLLIVSTPERSAYSEETGFENPYHVRELTLEQFHGLLSGEFEYVQTWAQRTVTGSLLARFGAEPGSETGQRFMIERGDDRWEVGTEMSPMYIVAVASNAPLPVAADLSVLADPKQGLLKHAQAAQIRAEELQQGAERNAEMVTRAAEAETTNLREQLLRTGDELADARRHAAELEACVADAEHLIATVQHELALAQSFRAGVEASQVWRLFQGARRRGYGALGGRQSWLGSFAERTIRLVTGVLLRRR